MFAFVSVCIVFFLCFQAIEIRLSLDELVPLMVHVEDKRPLLCIYIESSDTTNHTKVYLVKIESHTSFFFSSFCVYTTSLLLRNYPESPCLLRQSYALLLWASDHIAIWLEFLLCWLLGKLKKNVL